MRVSTNGYYNWLKTKETKHSNPSTEYLKMRIKIIFDKSKETYGATRVCKALERENLVYCRSYIALLMRQLGLKAVMCRKFKATTTDSNHRLPIAENKLNRDFRSQVLGQKWVSDITYVMVGSKWHYVTTVMDLADRKIISWVLSKDMTTENTVYKAWRKAREKRRITEGHVFHSDRGIQYASTLFSSVFKENMNQSMSRKGNCWDNAVAESFFKTLKYECVNRYQFTDGKHAYHIIDEYIDWYNNERLHSSLGYQTPAEKELQLRIKHFNKVA